jgi:hypothetical protein
VRASAAPVRILFAGLLAPVLLLVPALAPLCRAQQDDASVALPSAKAHDATLDEYRAHLQTLSGIVQNCAKARDLKSCDPSSVGADDQVPVPQTPSAAHRLVRYGWLRVLLSKARDKDAPPPTPIDTKAHNAPTWENVRPIPPTTSQLLKDAETRLASDLSQSNAAPAPLADHARERAIMTQVLSGRDFSNLEAPHTERSTMEKVGNWLNRVIEKAVRASARAPWLGRVLVWGFILAVCIGLVWGLLQLERRWRIRLVPEDRSPAPGAASAIPWQVWLEDARRAAAAGAWREAIHFLYWASISRLESKRLWPADRARTPREYLALVAGEDPRRPGLATLTGSFEHIWYGGRSASENDYQSAEQIATLLIHGSAATAGAAGLETAGGSAQ